MKRIIAFLLLCAMTLTICFSAMAWTETWTINPSSGGTFKNPQLTTRCLIQDLSSVLPMLLAIIAPPRRTSTRVSMVR